MLGKLIDIAIAPVVDVIDVVQGLSEGELREKAILRLGSEVVSGMAIGEVINFLTTDE